MTTETYIAASQLLDFDNPAVQELIATRGWSQLDSYQKIEAIYNFVRDEILFGYNAADDIPASQVLKDGYGQCNTKTTLTMALLRAVGVLCRFHGATVRQQMQKGAIPACLLKFAPATIVHSWIEVSYQGQWIKLEGVIIDRGYLNSVQRKFKGQRAFSGYAIATADLEKPAVEWRGEDTYIQMQSVQDDYGVYAQPEDFYAKYGGNLRGIRRWLYRYILRHVINRNVRRVRAACR